MLSFDAAGRFVAATRLDGVALLTDFTEPAEGPAGVRLLIDIAGLVRVVDARLRQHRADHGVVRRGPKACRETA